MHPGNRFELCHPDVRRDFFAENREVIPRTTFCLKEASLSRKYSMQNNLENSAFFYQQLFHNLIHNWGILGFVRGASQQKQNRGEDSPRMYKKHTIINRLTSPSSRHHRNILG